MGGKAIKNAKRMTLEQYEAVKLHIEKIMKTTLSGVEYSFPKELASKDSFGDLDVLVLADNENVKNEILLMLHHTFAEVVDSGSVQSVKFLEFQVDFIFVESDLDFAKEYFSHGDMGNLLGYYAMYLGYKLGRDGLYRSVNIPNVGKKHHYITKDWRIALNLLGFEAVKYPESFNDAYSMMNFVASSSLFKHDKENVFAWESLTSRHRSTVRKREGQRKFFKEYIGIDDETIDTVIDRKAERKIQRMKKKESKAHN